jgi:hypothetical protein
MKAMPPLPGGLPLGGLKLDSALGWDQRIDGQISRLFVDVQRKALREQGLDHLANLGLGCGPIDFRLDLTMGAIAIGDDRHPARIADDLMVAKLVDLLEQITQWNLVALNRPPERNWMRPPSVPATLGFTDATSNAGVLLLSPVEL